MFCRPFIGGQGKNIEGGLTGMPKRATLKQASKQASKQGITAPFLKPPEIEKLSGKGERFSFA